MAERRASNARAITLWLALLGIPTSIGLLFLPGIPGVAGQTTTSITIAFASLLMLGSYFLARRGQVTLGTLLAIGVALGQQTIIAGQPEAAAVTPFFAALFVFLAASALKPIWLAPVTGLAGLAILLQFFIAARAGTDTASLAGPIIGAFVLLAIITVISWLNHRSLERALDLARAHEEEREILSLELEKSARMEALGRLAGGIAHDFNNLLVVVQGSAELASEDIDENHPAQEELEQIQQAATRAGELTSQLLAFSKRQLVPPARIRPGKVIADLKPLVQRLVGNHLALTLDVRDTHDTILASSTQLEQVILNMAANARDATERGGDLTIILESRELRDGEAGDLPPGNYVEISVTDTGEGITEEAMAHLFEPFFTTKGPGKGTGLGLATCFGVVNQMGGTILVDSTVGEGTTFRIFIPVANTTGHQSQARIKVEHATRKLLVVDDDKTVRQLVSRVLSAEQIEVIEAFDLASSLEAAAKHSDLDLIITDVMLGSDDGTLVLEHLRKAHPGARLVVMSSFSPNKSAMDRLADTGASFLAKPFTNTQLLEIARSTPNDSVSAATHLDETGTHPN